MPHVNVTIAGRSYRMACNEGEEQHLQGLAADLDRRVGEMRGSFGEIDDGRLVVMAAISIADELAEVKKKLAAASDDVASAQETRLGAAARTKATQAAVAAALNSASERIERVARSLNESAGRVRGDDVPMG